MGLKPDQSGEIKGAVLGSGIRVTTGTANNKLLYADAETRSLCMSLRFLYNIRYIHLVSTLSTLLGNLRILVSKIKVIVIIIILNE